jgi:hypothetical protein
MKTIFLSILSVGFILFLPYNNIKAAAAENNDSLSISFFHKKVSYLENSPVFVEIELSNNTPAPYRFRFAEDRIFSLDFDVKELSSRAVEASDLVLRRRSSSAQVFYREITLEPGEAFSFIENLRDYVNLNKTGSYIVQCRLHPTLIRGTGTAVNGGAANVGTGIIRAAVNEAAPKAPEASVFSNKLSLSIRPNGIATAAGVPVMLDEATNANLLRTKLPPDEVVSYLLSARQKGQWEKFFLYLDLPALLSRDAAKNRQWRAESEEGRERMLARYRDELQTAVIDGDIAAIPMDFQIERTTYNERDGTVVVLEKFRTGGYTERKRFTYYLTLDNGIWTIVDYVVVNIGIE